MTVLHPSYLEPRLVLMYEQGNLPKELFLRTGLISVDGPIRDSDGQVKDCVCGDPLDANDPVMQAEPLKRTFLAARDCGHALHHECAFQCYLNNSRCPYCGVQHYDTDEDITQTIELVHELFDMKQGVYDIYDGRSRVSDDQLDLMAPQLKHSALVSAYHLLITGFDPTKSTQYGSVGMAAFGEGRIVVRTLLEVIDQIDLSSRSIKVLLEQIPSRIKGRMRGIKELPIETWVAIHDFATELTSLMLYHYAAGSGIGE